MIRHPESDTRATASAKGRTMSAEVKTGYLCPKGYKQTEVGVIPEDWDTRPCLALSDLTTVGIVIRPTQYYTEQGVPALRSANIREDGINNADMVFISEKANALLSKSQVRTGYPGTSAVVPPSFAGVNCIDILITRPSKAVSPNFLSAWINSSFGKSQVLRNQGGLAQQHFNVGDLRNLVVALPPTKAEQETIAEALSDADALIESLEQLLAKKRQLKQGAMQELLTGKKRLPGFTGEWEVKRLGDVASLYQPTTISAKHFTESGYPVYGANGVVGFYSQLNHETWQVTVTCRGSTCGTVNRTVDRCWITGNAMVLNCDQNQQLNKEFFYHLLCSQDLSDCITGTGQPQIVRAPLAAFEVPHPPTKAEQEAISAILSDMDAEIAALEAKLAKARRIKQGMMQELLTGKIRLV